MWWATLLHTSHQALSELSLHNCRPTGGASVPTYVYWRKGRTGRDYDLQCTLTYHKCDSTITASAVNSQTNGGHAPQWWATERRQANKRWWQEGLQPMREVAHNEGDRDGTQRERWQEGNSVQQESWQANERGRWDKMISGYVTRQADLGQTDLWRLTDLPRVAYTTFDDTKIYICNIPANVLAGTELAETPQSTRRSCRAYSLLNSDATSLVIP
ncbi:hypothetical protein F4604DRAFT_1675817 [Suillus subluteus]|nr:hypothetical protein F4604DRAFT_1675817 [Suillus subluteus]